MNIEAPIPVPQGDLKATLEDMAEHIAKLSKLGKEFMNSRLKHRTVVLLLHDLTGISKTNIVNVLKALPDLEKEFLK